VTTSASQSLWLATTAPTEYPVLRGVVEADVAVVGGGITGLTTALLLRRAGLTVAVIEAARVGSGVTGCTTAKVTALQGTVYSTIAKRHGVQAAATYAAASVDGVERLASLAQSEGIECSLQRRPAYTYAASRDERRTVEHEAEIAGRAGLPVRFVEQVDLPYASYGAVCLDEQVQIHPVQYTQGLARLLAGAVYERSRVVAVDEGAPCRVRTDEGEVRAEHVVVAAHAPFLDRGLYFARLLPSRSYCIAARLASGAPPSGMGISAGSPTRSVRSYGELLLVGGEAHATGAAEATPQRYRRLETFARSHWDVGDVSYRWSAQDPAHYDRLPVIGPYRLGSARLWVAAGFMKWGMATASFAAGLLTDSITGRDNPWAAAFTPSRVSARSLTDVARLAATFGTRLVRDRLQPASTPGESAIPRGEARVVRDGQGRTGVYRDDDGRLHAVCLRCTHMGCVVQFNSAERSWDCPCHGSRFDVDGAVLEGPAGRPLERRTPRLS
jgi:glycine/D-amino acid oxidase-like deaminating enzyme/nitrite reductase/ring-hydroxylating ferredoxin subunit